MDWMARGSNPNRGKRFFSSPEHSDWIWSSPLCKPSWHEQGKLQHIHKITKAITSFFMP